jgi:hypothetical protein
MEYRVALAMIGYLLLVQQTCAKHFAALDVKPSGGS